MYHLTVFLLLGLGVLSVAGFATCRIEEELGSLAGDLEPEQVLAKLKEIQASTGRDMGLVNWLIKLGEDTGPGPCMRGYLVILESYIQFYNQSRSDNLYRFLKHHQDELHSRCVPYLLRYFQRDQTHDTPEGQVINELMGHVQATSPDTPNHLLSSVPHMSLTQGLAEYMQRYASTSLNCSTFASVFSDKIEKPCRRAVDLAQTEHNDSATDLLFRYPDLVSRFSPPIAEFLSGVKLCERIIGTKSLALDTYWFANLKLERRDILEAPNKMDADVVVMPKCYGSR